MLLDVLQCANANDKHNIHRLHGIMSDCSNRASLPEHSDTDEAALRSLPWNPAKDICMERRREQNCTPRFCLEAQHAYSGHR